MRGRGRPNGFLQQVFDKTVFEPAHFIMERGMLRGIAARAERSAVNASSSTP
jgi:hypothetical protein